MMSSYFILSRGVDPEDSTNGALYKQVASFLCLAELPRAGWPIIEAPLLELKNAFWLDDLVLHESENCHYFDAENVDELLDKLDEASKDLDGFAKHANRFGHVADSAKIAQDIAEVRGVLTKVGPWLAADPSWHLSYESGW
jgi:hypothetical protein